MGQNRRGARLVPLTAIGGARGPLARADVLWQWHGGALTAFGAIAGYVLTRSVAGPFDTDDVGNWVEPLGLVALYTGLTVLMLYGCALRAWPAVLRRPAATSTTATVDPPT